MWVIDDYGHHPEEIRVTLERVEWVDAALWSFFSLIVIAAHNT